MDGEEGRRRRIIRQPRQVMVVQRDAAFRDAFPRLGTGEQLARRAQHRRSLAGFQPRQAGEEHHRLDLRPGDIAGQGFEVPRDGREGADRGA